MFEDWLALEVRDHEKVPGLRIDPDAGLTLSSSAKKRLQSYTRPEKREAILLANTPALKPAVSKRIEKAITDAKAGKNLSPAFTSADEAIAWLEKEK